METTYTIEQQAQFVEGAGTRFEREQAALFDTHNGQTYKVYSDEIHAERLAALRAEADATFTDAEATADRVSKSAMAVLDHQAHGDPGDSLTEAQLVKANARKPFVEQDCQTLTHSALTARVKTVLDGGDASLAYLYFRGLQDRLGASDRNGNGEGQPGTVVALTPAAAAERQELRALAGELDALLRGPNTVQKAEAARRDLARARELRRSIAKVAGVVHDAAGRTKKDLLASGRYSI